MTMLKIRDVSLYVKVMGRGYPLLLMHGGPGLDHTTLETLEPLAKRFTLIFYDHRANGRSTGATETMTFSNLVADAEALRESLGFDRWAVAGHSFGGHVALEYALRHPDRISALLLLDTAADAYWYQRSAPAILEKRGWSKKAVGAAKRFFNGELTLPEIRPAVMRFFFAYFYKLRLRDVPGAIAAAFKLKMRPEAIVQGFSVVLKRWSVMDRLPEINVPTLVLAGREDFLFPPEQQAMLAARIPRARLEIIEHAGHSPHVEQASRVIPIIARFVAAAATAPASAVRPHRGWRREIKRTALLDRAIRRR
ncbi:MAG TPA: alpha/beta fold hydrolase [Gemmatimonadaceae bacterium]|nr:alpha/beta fold hydrolase [Gemmatimonadaceae bacterium]